MNTLQFIAVPATLADDDLLLIKPTKKGEFYMYHPSLSDKVMLPLLPPLTESELEQLYAAVPGWMRLRSDES